MVLALACVITNGITLLPRTHRPKCIFSDFLSEKMLTAHINIEHDNYKHTYRLIILIVKKC